MRWNEKIKKTLYNICELLELLTAALMVVGVGMAIVGFFLESGLFRDLLRDPGALMIYVERVFTIVIGIEFLQMLTRPDTDNVIEIIIFLMARHMIIEETTPIQDLISILGITILIVLRWVVHDIRRQKERERAAREGKDPESVREGERD